MVEGLLRVVRRNRRSRVQNHETLRQQKAIAYSQGLEQLVQPPAGRLGDGMRVKEFLVIEAAGVHPVSSRTRQLSPPAPMVLVRRRTGSVGHCQVLFSPSYLPPTPHSGGFFLPKTRPWLTFKASHRLALPPTLILLLQILREFVCQFPKVNRLRDIIITTRL